MLHTIGSVLRDEGAQGLTEYALILGLVAVAATGVLIALSGSINGEFTSASTDI